MLTEIIISTYNNPRSLALCLASVAGQVRKPDSICIADDGSGPETRSVIDNFSATSAAPVRHVWHEDRGFEKGAILNKAIASSTAEFLVFIDGDVLIHPQFVARHVELARPGRFSTGSLIRLDEVATAGVQPAQITDGTVFLRAWLRANRAIDRSGTWLKTRPFPKAVMSVLEILSPIRRSFCGANASAFRADLMAVNGYDERMKYGGQDKELGIRLANSGVRGRHLRYTAPLVHLDHPRGYDDPEKRRFNREIIDGSRAQKRTWTESGIIKGPRR